jgi:hypothetical protein
MSNALFAFDATEPAHGAARELVDAGIPRAAIMVHLHGSSGPPTDAVTTDELVTGGIVTNLLDLFQGLFDWGSSPHDASSFEDVVRHGGAVLEIDAADHEQQARIDRVMQEAGSTLRTGWSDAPKT